MLTLNIVQLWEASPALERTQKDSFCLPDGRLSENWIAN